MRSAPVESFGRRSEPQEEEQASEVVLLPPLALPPVQCPLVLVVDPEGLRGVAEQITEMVAQAVRDGVEQGLAGSGPRRWRVTFDPGDVDQAAAHIAVVDR